MPSFDIVSKTDREEVDNAVSGIMREVAQRFDFKGSKCSIEYSEDQLIVLSDDDLKLKQMHELIKVYFIRRHLDPACLEYKDPEKATGNTVRQFIIVKQGIDKDTAKKIVKELKDSKLKIQAAIQGDELRISGKKRDDLQEAISFIKNLKIPLPLQYINFRD